MTTCFYTIYDVLFKETAKGLVNSILNFYPEIPVFEYEIPRAGANIYAYHSPEFNLKNFCEYHLLRGKKLLEEYDRVICIDADSIMTAPCPDFFLDFDLGVVKNNIGEGLNAGVTVCTNKLVWQEWIDVYQKKEAEGFQQLNEQEALNYVWLNSKFDVYKLEFPDRVYGISAMDDYPKMYLRDNDLYVGNKKLCLFHAAGTEYKKNGKITLDLIEDPEARKALQERTIRK